MRAEVRELALEGHDCREIGARLGLGKSTVHRWLHELRGESQSNVADADEVIANSAARYDTIYREAMEAWRNSKGERQELLVEVTETDGEGGSSKRKRSVRTERRAGEIGFLAKATAAVNARCKLVPREALERKFAAARPPVDLESLDDEDIRNLSNAELNALEAEVEARIAAEEAAEKANGTKRGKGGTS